ncbi:universal stress protein [Glutamicibacter halophytocola]|uniref:universal stress protein n=1 Tax=Glutamicibacter halophytocola TaxID=1933880 RepID=UPI00321BF27D
MKLLVGYTADDRGAEAIELASALVSGTPGAALQIAIVLPAAAPFNAVYPGGDHGYSSILSAQVDQWAEQALALVPAGIHATVAARSVPSVAEGLIGLAQQYEADGIVLGGRKRHRAGFFLPGAIANALASLLAGVGVHVLAGGLGDLAVRQRETDPADRFCGGQARSQGRY